MSKPVVVERNRRSPAWWIAAIAIVAGTTAVIAQPEPLPSPPPVPTSPPPSDQDKDKDKATLGEEDKVPDKGTLDDKLENKDRVDAKGTGSAAKTPKKTEKIDKTDKTAKTTKDQNKPNIVILATGGTIAGAGTAGGYGYTSGQFKVDDLINAVPGLDKLANLSGEQVANIGSQDMNDAVWLKLAKRANEVLADSDVDGIVITHGTDTMEETAYFLDLVIKSKKPVVLVGSMRPATAVSADGPANLYNGVAAAASDGARGRGVLVVLNDSIHAARNVIKTNTTNVETFASPTRGPAGYVTAGTINWFERMDKRHTTDSEFDIKNVDALPRVDIVYAHANMDDTMIKAARASGAKGIVVAGVGDGNMTKAALDALTQAAKEGVVVVRSTRLPAGMVMRNAEVDDDKLGFVASGELNPGKSRVLLQLALTKTADPKAVQEMFRQY